MLNSTIQIKIQQRLNKLSSNDYDNIEPWAVVEAFNKAQVMWCRRQIHALNIKQEGDEQTNRRIDDLQVILTEVPVQLTNQGDYYESNGLPADYFEWKRVDGLASNDCCNNPKKMKIWLVAEGDIDDILRDPLKRPSFEWGETICTLKNNNLRIYTNGDFAMPQTNLSYYRQPRRIEITGSVDPYTGVASPVDIISEFKDDVVEVMIDEAAKIIAGDIESFNQRQIGSAEAEGNN